MIWICMNESSFDLNQSECTVQLQRLLDSFWPQTHASKILKLVWWKLRGFFLFIFFFHSDFRKILQIYFTPNFCFLFSLSKSAHKGMRNCLRGRRHRSDGRKKKKMYKQQTYSVPLSTIWVSREMPSRLMNSWAKVMSREALARSFRASSLASMLDDWIRSWSVTAVWYWNGQMEVGGHALKVAWHTYCLYRMGLVYLRT